MLAAANDARVKILHHDACFDGAASAAVFCRFYRERIDPRETFIFQGLSHGAKGPLEETLFDHETNVVVDFRYSPSPKLTWWFDHHASAFPNPGEEAHFRARTDGRAFYDPTAASCTKFLSRVARERFGFDDAPLRELIDWAEIIDGAKFPDARTAVRLEEPALKLMLVLEATPGPTLIPAVIQRMQSEPLAGIVAAPDVQERLTPLYEAHLASIALVQERARLDNGVVAFDLSDKPVHALNKFIPYDLFPEARYTVSVTSSPGRAKISVGSNPWGRVPRTHDIAQLCERYGGGGHPAVGAISLPPEQIERAREIARAIVRELGSEGER